jgi:hypothetical protein
MNAQHHGELVRRIGAAPARVFSSSTHFSFAPLSRLQYIESARHQSPQGLAALLDLSMAWADVPGMMELGIIDMFLGHLREEKAPTLGSRPSLNRSLNSKAPHPPPLRASIKISSCFPSETRK